MQNAIGQVCYVAKIYNGISIPSPRTSVLRPACLACLGVLLDCSLREMHVGLGGCPTIGASDMLGHTSCSVNPTILVLVYIIAGIFRILFVGKTEVKDLKYLDFR